jgi:hypothetical protein
MRTVKGGRLGGGGRKNEQKYGIKGQTATNTHYFALSISWNSLDLR